MKKFSQLINETEEKNKISLNGTPVNIISEEDIRKYLEIADKFISNEAKEVCNWVLDNYDYYVKNINSLYDFYNSGSPSNKELTKLYSNIRKVNDSGRVLEIPFLMTKNDFNSILNLDKSPDEVIMDFNTEKGRNEIAKRYIPLVHKIVNSWIGKTALDRDELFSAGMRGIAEAIKAYGKKSDKAVKRGIDIDVSKYKSYPFLQFAAQYIRICILEDAKDNSHLVRIPRSKQSKDKENNGFITKSNSVSGDTPIKNKDGANGKSLFDLVGDVENPSREIDKREIDSMWEDILNKLEEKFGEKTMDIFKNHFGFGLKHGEKKLSGKEMAEKYGYSSPSSITSVITKVLLFIKKDNDMFSKFQEIYDLMQEAKHDEDEYSNDNEPVYLSTKIMEDRMYGFNNIDGDE